MTASTFPYDVKFAKDIVRGDRIAIGGIRFIVTSVDPNAYDEVVIHFEPQEGLSLDEESSVGGMFILEKNRLVTFLTK